MRILFALLISAFSLQPSPSAQQAVDDLLAADRAFSTAAAAKANVIEALTPMFSADVIMTQPGGKFARGVDEVIAALKLNPDNLMSKVEWTPIRGGISADGTQGFTFGFMTLKKPDGTTTPVKYMSYWVKSGSAWHVAAYKRSRRPEGDVSLAMMPPSLPEKMMAPSVSDEAARAEVAAAEKSFSDDAQKVGLGPAFLKYGAPDAVNMGGLPNFLVGNDKIAESVDGGRGSAPSEVRWAADEKVIAASSGDLGVSIGLIRLNAPLPDGSTPPPSAFFTIWRKINGVWKYIAE